MKFYSVLSIVVALALVSGSAIAGNTVGQSGYMTSSSGSESSDESTGSVHGVAESVEGDEFDADIFQDDQGQSDLAVVADPFEGLNRAMFFFNDKLYMYGLRPIAKGYVKVVPTVARKGVKNFFTNLLFPIRFVNALLQGKGEAAGREFSAFFINTTLGFGGLNNFAQKYVGIQLEDEDFGQTLGSYGVGSGIYLVLPVLGPVRSGMLWAGQETGSLIPSIMRSLGNYHGEPGGLKRSAGHPCILESIKRLRMLL